MAGHAEPVDQAVEEMKAGRKSPAVLKARLANLRSEIPTTPVFALEGIDDKLVYFQWVQRVRPNLSYEPFTCGGKRYVFDLFTMLQRDLGDLAHNVFFFVDRDFDDWAGYAIDDSIFMTDRYSTENYLVESSVLDTILRDDLHCDGFPKVRSTVVKCFESVYEEFLKETSELNFILFCGKRLRIPMSTGGAPDKLGGLIKISLDGAKSGNVDIQDLLTLERDFTEEELFSLAPDFGEFNAKLRYRGKYALQFFTKWLQLIAQERVEQKTSIFYGVNKLGKLKFGELSLSVLASRSPLPEGFREFVNAI
jgi:hypothetical protein